MSPLRFFGFVLFLSGLAGVLYYGYKYHFAGELAQEIPVSIGDEASVSFSEYWKRNISALDTLNYTSIISPDFFLSPELNPIELKLVISKYGGTTTGSHNNVSPSIFSLIDGHNKILWREEGATQSGRKSTVGRKKTEYYRIHRFEVDDSKQVRLFMNINKKLISGRENNISVIVRANAKLPDLQILGYGGLLLLCGIVILSMTYKNPHARKRRKRL